MKYTTITTIIAAAILTPLQAEEPAKANYNKAMTESDALDKDTTDKAVHANYAKSLTKSDALSKKEGDDAANANYVDSKTNSDALEKKDKALVTLFKTAEHAGTFDTFITAVKAAGLAEFLTASDTNVTIFAPNDEAFDRLPDGTLEELLKPENKDKLISVLKYHIIPDRAMAGDIISSEIMTLNGEIFTVMVTEKGEVMVNKANVIATDTEASNGLIHEIDMVLIPES